jgi:hypothetical protein
MVVTRPQSFDSAVSMTLLSFDSVVPVTVANYYSVEQGCRTLAKVVKMYKLSWFFRVFKGHEELQGLYI